MNGGQLEGVDDGDTEGGWDRGRIKLAISMSQVRGAGTRCGTRKPRKKSKPKVMEPMAKVNRPRSSAVTAPRRASHAQRPR